MSGLFCVPVVLLGWLFVVCALFWFACWIVLVVVLFVFGFVSCA